MSALKKLRQRNRAIARRQDPVRAQWDRATVISLVSAAIAACSAIVAFRQLSIAESSAAAAARSAQTAERALTGVQRPILFLKMLSDAAPLPGIPFAPDAPIFTIAVENIGKQLANLITGNANHILKQTSEPPDLVSLGGLKGWCHVRLVGEIVVRPTPEDRQIIQCQRQGALTEAERKGIENGSLYEFFRIALTYSDPLGTLRVSRFNFAKITNGIPGQMIWRQIQSDDVLPKNPTMAAEAHRKLTAQLLELYNRLDWRAGRFPGLQWPHQNDQ